MHAWYNDWRGTGLELSGVTGGDVGFGVGERCALQITQARGLLNHHRGCDTTQADTAQAEDRPVGANWQRRFRAKTDPYQVE